MSGDADVEDECGGDNRKGLLMTVSSLRARQKAPATCDRNTRKRSPYDGCSLSFSLLFSRRRGRNVVRNRVPAEHNKQQTLEDKDIASFMSAVRTEIAVKTTGVGVRITGFLPDFKEQGNQLQQSEVKIEG